MRLRLGSLGIAVSWLAMLGCREPTQIRLMLTTDVVEDRTTDALVAFSFGTPEEAETAVPTTEYQGPWNERIGDLFVVPSDEKNAAIGIKVMLGIGREPSSCTPEDFEGCIVARRRLRFLENETIELPIPLPTRCEGVPCEPETTCTLAGRCVDAKVNVKECVKNGGDSCLPEALDDLGTGGTSGAGGVMGMGGNTTTGMGGSGATSSVGGATGTGGAAGSGTGGNGGATTTTGGGNGGGGTGGTPDPGGLRAAFTVTPSVGDLTTEFSFDASGTFHPDYALAELDLAWDFGDGSGPGSQPLETHTYTAADGYQVTLTVTAPDGSSVATESVFVTDPNRPILAVDTDQDEDNIGATIEAPLGTGLSLREAILLANTDPGLDTITMDPGLTYLSDVSQPIISDALVLSGGVIEANGGVMGDCLEVRSDNVLIDGLTIQACQGAPLTLTSGTNVEVRNSYFSDSLDAVYVVAPNARFIGNTVLNGSGNGVTVSGAGVRVQRNLIVQNGVNLTLDAGADGAVVVHNTLVGASGSAILLNAVSGADVRNNILFGSGAFGVEGSDSSLAAFDYNLFFQNASGNCSACTPGANSLLDVNPLFVDEASLDFGLMATSSAIDAAFDLGLDVNGAAAGLFNGNAPDIGAVETQ